jgi:hypothetical protein
MKKFKYLFGICILLISLSLGVYSIQLTSNEFAFVLLYIIGTSFVIGRYTVQTNIRLYTEEFEELKTYKMNMEKLLKEGVRK